MTTKTRNRRPLLLLIAVLAAFGLIAAACGSDDDVASDATEAPDESSDTTAAPDDSADTTAAPDDSGDTTAAPSGDGPLQIALVAPSASNDLAFTQSMVDALDAIGQTRDIEVQVTDGTFIVEDAAAALRGYADDGVDLVLAHGSQYGGPLQEIAPDFPEVSFAWGTTTDTFGLPNVFAYTTRSDQGAYVMGIMAAEISESGVIGVVGPVEVGDAKLYVDGFVAGAAAQNPSVQVNVNYIESFSDVALAAEAAEAHVSNNSDVLTGTAQMVVGATGVALDNNIAWFGTQANQTELGPSNVVASQVYHWEVILEQMLANMDSGVLGGETYGLTLENGGLVIEYNDGFDLSADVRALGDEAVAGLIDGSITTGIE